MAQRPGKGKPKSLILRTEIHQGNPLIQARKEFDTLGMRLFMLGLRGLNPHFSLNDKEYDEKFPKLFIPTAQVVELFGGNTAYLHNLKPACEKLFNAIIELNYENGGFTLLHLFNELHYEPQEGLYLQFDESMRPYLLDLFESKGYTKISVEQIFYLTSPYAVRLIELMLQYQNIPKFKIKLEITREMTIEELRFALNVPADAYEGRLDNFRQKVIDEPIAEINEKTIYQISYKVIKQGRNITGFEFHMDMRAVPVNDERLRYSSDAINELCRLGFSLTAAKEILSICSSEDDCLKRIVTAKKILQKQKGREQVAVRNDLGFLRTAIIENWNLDSECLPQVQKSKPKPKPKTKPKTKSPALPTPSQIFEDNRKKKSLIYPEKVESPKKQDIPVGVQEMFIEMLGDSKNKKTIESMLKVSGWTLEEFKEKYMTPK